MKQKKMRRFAEAIFLTRAMRSSLTVDGLYAALHVASAPAPVTFEAFSEAIGKPYNSAAIQAAQLSEGRANLPGSGLLERIPGADRKQKLLRPTFLGLHMMSLYADGKRDEARTIIRGNVMPALASFRKEAPGMSVTTLSVFLFCAENRDAFLSADVGYGALLSPLGANNLPNHVARLQDPAGDGSVPGLIISEPDPGNRRKRRLMISDHGDRVLDLMADSLSADSLHLPYEPRQDPDEPFSSPLCDP